MDQAACHQDPGTEHAIERVARESIAGVEALGESEEAPEAVKAEAGQRIGRSRRHLEAARLALEAAPVRRDEAFEGMRGRLMEGLAQLRALEEAGPTLTAEDVLNGLTGVQRLVEVVWVRVAGLKEMTAPAEAKASAPVSA